MCITNHEYSILLTYERFISTCSDMKYCTDLQQRAPTNHLFFINPYPAGTKSD